MIGKGGGDAGVALFVAQQRGRHFQLDAGPLYTGRTRLAAVERRLVTFYVFGLRRIGTWFNVTRPPVGAYPVKHLREAEAWAVSAASSVA